MKAEQFYNDNLIDGELPADKMVELLNMDPDFFDNVEQKSVQEDKVEPEEEVASTESEEKIEEPEKEEPKEPEEPMVEAQDGKATIPFSTLKETRDELNQTKSQLENLVRENAEIKEALAKLTKMEEQAEAGKASAEERDEQLEEVREEFPELVQAFEKMLSKERQVFEQRIKERDEKIAKLEKDVEPVKLDKEESDMEAHFKAITEAHSDFDKIMEGTELADWHSALPKTLQDAYADIMDHGTADEVNYMLKAFKDATGYGAAPGDKGDQNSDGKEAALARAEKAAAKARDEAVPKSLSDVPASSVAHHDEIEAMTEMSTLNLLNKFSGKTPDEIEALLARAS